MTMSQPRELRACALQWLVETSPAAKAAGVMALAAASQSGELALDSTAGLDTSATIPGRPDRP